MILNCGTLTAPTATGTLDVTHGMASAPQILMFFGGGLTTAEGNGTHAKSFFGFSDGTNEYCRSAHMEDAQVTPDGPEGTSVTKAGAVYIRGRQGGFSVDEILAAVTVIDATKFTLNFTTLHTAAQNTLIYWIGIAGLTSVYAGSFAMNTTTGNQAVTTPGFQGDCILFLPVPATALGSSNAAYTTGFGAALSSSSRFAAWFDGVCNADPVNSAAWLMTTLCLGIGAAASSLHTEADFVSFDTNGFTINFTDPPGSAYLCPYLVLKGGNYSIGTFNQPSSTGSQAVESGLSFAPKGTLFVSRSETSGAAEKTDHAKHSVGFGKSASSQRAMWAGVTDNVSTTEGDHSIASNRCLQLQEAGTPTLKSDAAYEDNGASSVSVDWQTVDATARMSSYLILGEPGAAGIVPFRRRIEGY